jgi:hypothetical protein
MATKDEDLKTVVDGKKPVGKHLKIVKRSIKKRDIDPVKAEMLRGLARAWDLIEESGQHVASIPSICREMREIWDSIGNPPDDIAELWKS